MLFIHALTVPRAGRLPNTFCHSWDKQFTSDALSCVGHTLAEFMNQDSAPGKLYLDRDVYIDGPLAPSLELISEHMRVVRTTVQGLVDRLSTKDNNLSYVIATRHGLCKSRGKYKLSFRPFIQGMSIMYTHIPVVIKLVGQQDFWDMSVYKVREQLLAAINGCKGRIGCVTDARLLNPEQGSPSHDLLMYVAQHVDLGWPFLDVPLDFNPHPRTPQPLEQPQRSSASVASVRSMVASLSATTSSDRSKWIIIGMVLKKEGSGDMYYKDWLEFSKRSHKFVSEADCEKTWVGLQSSGQCGIGTLRFHATRDTRTRWSSVNINAGARILRAMKNF